jgi:hypothetical protein
LLDGTTRGVSERSVIGLVLLPMDISIPEWLGGPSAVATDDADNKTEEMGRTEEKDAVVAPAPAPMPPQPSIMEKDALHTLRLRDGDLGLGFSVLLLDSTVEEGQEFLMYAFPAATPESVRMIGMRMSFSLLGAVMDSVAKQPVRLVKFLDTRDQQHLKVCSVALTGSLEGCMLVFATWLPIPDAVMPSLLLTLMDMVTLSAGPLARQDLQTDSDSPCGQTDLEREGKDGGAEEKGKGNPVQGVQLSMSFAAMAKLDPVLRLFGTAFFQGDAEGWFLSTVPACAPWFHPSLQLAHSLSAILSQLESSPREHADIAALSSSSSSSDAVPSASAPSASRVQSRNIRACHSLGATLYLKNLVVASHLPAPALKSTTTFLQVRGLLRKSDDEPTRVSFHQLAINPSGSPDARAVVDRLCGASGSGSGEFVLSVVNMGRLTLTMLLRRIPGVPLDGALDPFFFMEMRELLLNLISSKTDAQLERERQVFNKHLVSPVHNFSIQGQKKKKDAGKPRKDKGKKMISAVAAPESKRESSSDLHSAIFDFITLDSVQGTIVYGHSENAVLPLIRSDFVKMCVQLRAQMDTFARSDGASTAPAVSPGQSDAKSHFQAHAMIDVMGVVSELAVKRTSVVETSDPMDASKTRSMAVSYWAVARRYSAGVTCFICYEDDSHVPHHVVELAFRLSFSMNRG